MKAAALTGRNQVKMVELPEPKVRTPEEVVVEVEALSVCTTDSEVIDGTMAPRKLPIIIGHEASGRVSKVGGGVKNVMVGDRVLIDPNKSDGTCHLCLSGLSHLCQNGGLMGRELDGVFAESVVVQEGNVHKLPASVPIEIAPLIQPFSTVVHAFGKVTLAKGDVVLVLGLGVTGLMLVQLAKQSGALVIGSSTNRERLNLAKRLGASIAVDRSETDIVSEVMRATLNRGVDVVFDASGYRNLLTNDFIRVLKPGGMVLLFATRLRELEIDAFESYFRELTFKTSRSSQSKDFESAIGLVGEKRIDLSYQVTRTFPFDRTLDALAYFEDRRRVLKTVIITE